MCSLEPCHVCLGAMPCAIWSPTMCTWKPCYVSLGAMPYVPGSHAMCAWEPCHVFLRAMPCVPGSHAWAMYCLKPCCEGLAQFVHIHKAVYGTWGKIANGAAAGYRETWELLCSVGELHLQRSDSYCRQCQGNKMREINNDFMLKGSKRTIVHLNKSGERQTS